MNYNELQALRHPADGKPPCVEAVEWFLATYGRDTDVQVTAETLRAVPDRRWIYWLSDALGLQLKYKFAGIAFRHAAKVHPELAPYADNVTPENAVTAADAADAANAAAADAADAAYATAMYAADAAADAAAAMYAADAAYATAAYAADAANAAAMYAADATADAANAAANAAAADADADAADTYAECFELAVTKLEGIGSH